MYMLQDRSAEALVPPGCGAGPLGGPRARARTRPLPLSSPKASEYEGIQVSILESSICLSRHIYTHMNMYINMMLAGGCRQ